MYDYYLPRPHQSSFIGGRNFLSVLQDARFLSSLGRTGVLMVSTITIEFFLGLGIAMLFFGEARARKFLVPTILIPMMITPVIVGYMWRLLYQVQAGPINYLLSLFFGLGPYEWTSGASTALFSIVIADVWQWTPFVMLILLAGITALPLQVFEAAEVDGASGWQRFIHIILPMLKRLIAIVLLFRILDIFRMFDKIYVMTAGGPGSVTETASLYAYFSGFKYFRIGYAAAMALLLLAVTVGISTTVAKVLHRE